MANIMIRKSHKGYVFYMPKRDIEDSIISMEFDSAEKWGGEIDTVSDCAQDICFGMLTHGLGAGEVPAKKVPTVAEP